MAVFHGESEDFQRLDWALLQNGAITLYLRPEFLAEDAEWLKAHNYRVDTFNCAAWESEEVMQPTAEVMSRTRGGIRHPPGGAVVDTTDYEVSIFEVSS